MKKTAVDFKMLAALGLFISRFSTTAWSFLLFSSVGLFYRSHKDVLILFCGVLKFTWVHMGEIWKERHSPWHFFSFQIQPQLLRLIFIKQLRWPVMRTNLSVSLLFWTSCTVAACQSICCVKKTHNFSSHLFSQNCSDIVFWKAF